MMVPPASERHGWCCTTRLHRYGSVSRIGLCMRGGSSFFSGAHAEPGDERDDGEREADEQRRDLQAGAEQCDGQEPGGDDAAPAGDLDAVLGEAEQRGQQGHGGDHGDGHGGGCADAEARR